MIIAKIRIHLPFRPQFIYEDTNVLISMFKRLKCPYYPHIVKKKNVLTFSHILIVSFLPQPFQIQWVITIEYHQTPASSTKPTPNSSLTITAMHRLSKPTHSLTSHPPSPSCTTNLLPTKPPSKPNLPKNHRAPTPTHKTTSKIHRTNPTPTISGSHSIPNDIVNHFTTIAFHPHNTGKPIANPNTHRNYLQIHVGICIYKESTYTTPIFLHLNHEIVWVKS